MNFSHRNRFKPVLAAVVFAFLPASVGFAYTGGVFSSSAAPTSPTTFVVNIGGGHNNDNFTNALYTPDTLNIYVGDRVTFRTRDKIEPHTVTFGPQKTLDRLAANFITPIPGKNGPPTLAFENQVILPTTRRTYDGSGYANSGLLSSDYPGVLEHTAWTITFTKAGIYHYYCLIHFPGMTGTIIVHARSEEPLSRQAHMYLVQAGYPSVYPTSPLIADTFFPEDLTIHAGSTVVWPAAFHTVTFAPSARIKQLRRAFALKRTVNGKVQYYINPEDAFPSTQNGCGASAKTACSYTGGFLNSGILGQGGPQKYFVTFPKAGVYRYGCLVHKGMDGKITVLAAGKS
ncbi:MAG TPA: hypothetical protein VFB34_06695 [Chloroflexota bacterium]|nr:hypothetical protein [Chloroflexota bacterium]